MLGVVSAEEIAESVDVVFVVVEVSVEESLV